MKKIIKGRFVILAIWLVASVLLTVFQPDVNAILRNRGQQPLGEDAQSAIAQTILDKMESATGNNDLIVFYSEDGFSNAEKEQIKNGLDAIDEVKSELGITNIIDPVRNTDYESYLIADDKTTMMVSMKVDKGDREVSDIASVLDSKLTNVETKYYFTGEDFISDDYLQEAMSGVEKSAVLTVIFILLVLMLMFRSVVTPVISLIAVAFSYLCSMGIAAQLIDKAGFPITSLTQMLLVLILFGIGTDYNILLFNRFKEEMANGLSIDEAIIATYKTAGKTIVFSIMTVFIAFLSLLFSESPIYQSGVVVVIGAAILLLEIVTLTPFFMKTLGARLFWPTKKNTSHKESKFWAKTTMLATKHPFLSILVVLILITPTIVFHEQKLTSDSLSQLSDDYGSVKGFNLVSEHFGEGQSMPATLVIESTDGMDNNDALAVIDEITKQVKDIDGVSNVVSVTQPEGKEMEDFYVSKQMTSVTDGLDQTKDGVDEINNGLQEATAKLTDADFSQVSKLVDGTSQLKDGVDALENALETVEKGLSSGSTNTESVSSGITTIKKNLTAMSTGLDTLQSSYMQMQSGYEQMGSSYQQVAAALLGIKSSLGQMQVLVNALGGTYINSSSDTNYIQLKLMLDGLVTSLDTITPEGIATLNAKYDQVTNGFATANESLTSMSDGLEQMANGLESINAGVRKTADGVGVIVTNMENIEQGLSEMKTGQQQLVDGLAGFGTFGNQLTQVTDGLTQIADGMEQANGFLEQYSENKTFYVPKEAFASAEFTKLLNNFMTEDRTITKLTIVLDDNPYSLEAQDTLNQIDSVVKNVVAGSVLENATVGISGTTATAKDMNNILSADLNRMIVIVLIGIFIVLVVLTRSIWEPIVIILCLVGSYYAATLAMNVFFLNILGNDGIQSFVPFFTFIIIVALGVDYSIFLMMRYKECRDMSHREAIVTASKNIGGVVMSAVIILGGTFATLIPSGFAILVQLGVAVIAGLIVLCLIMLPFFLPAMIALPAVIGDWKNRRNRKE